MIINKIAKGCDDKISTVAEIRCVMTLTEMGKNHNSDICYY